jgi:hypothetical protein
LGRFIQADPLIDAGTQGLNRYSYVLNNPLTHTDPSGYLSTREWGSIFTTLIITFGTRGQGLVAQLAGGAMLGATQSQSIKGAAWGAFSSLAYFGVGSYFESAAWAKTGVHVFGTKLNLAGYSAKVLSHGVLGGGVQHLQGGRFGSGFAAAGLTEATSGIIDGIDPSNPDVSRALRIATAGMVGGTASALTGGKFAAGFITAAFARAYNAEGHEETCDEVCVIERDYRELLAIEDTHDSSGRNEEEERRGRTPMIPASGRQVPRRCPEMSEKSIPL